MTLALIFTAGAVFEFIVASLIGRMFKAANRAFDRHVDQALHMVSQDRLAQIKAAHPSGGRDRRAWAAVVGQDGAVTRIGRI
jgi:hypothetical protein